MADEPTDMVMRLLRDIRAKQAKDSERLLSIEHRLDEMSETPHMAAGFAVHANARHDVVGKDLEAIKARLAKLEENA